jgi:uncharacterized tellurite resistance protein B-like protein
MGLFDGIKSKVATNLTPQQAVMAIVIAAVKTDGEVENAEIARLQAMCGLSPLFASNTSDQDRALVSAANTLTNQLGQRAVERAGEALSPALRETAFAFACDMVLADGVLADTEEQFLSKLAADLKIDEAVAESIAMVTIIRNRGLSD